MLCAFFAHQIIEANISIIFVKSLQKQKRKQKHSKKNIEQRRLNTWQQKVEVSALIVI